MRKQDMRLMLDELIKEQQELIELGYKVVERLEKLRSEMHNRPRRMQSKATSRRMSEEVRRAILNAHMRNPNWSQREIAERLKVHPGRVSETIAGKRL